MSVEFDIQKFGKLYYLIPLYLILVAAPFSVLLAGGGMVIEGDVCIIRIDFYSAHFTAYQPAKRGSEQFCQRLPDTGETIFVLDYLHQSMREVPVSFRIIRDVTGQGDYVKLKHVEALEDIESLTVFYQQPTIRSDASLKIEHDFTQEGDYIGIVTVGHPSNDLIYTAVFPFTVGGSIFSVWMLLYLFVGVATFLLSRKIMTARQGRISQEAGL